MLIIYSLLFIYVPSQQLQGQLQTQHSVDAIIIIIIIVKQCSNNNDNNNNKASQAPMLIIKYNIIIIQ
jgi:hypothetical protein